MNICILGYPRVDGKIVNGIAKVTHQFTTFFESCGDNVYNYHLFTKKQYDELSNFCIENKIDIALWNMSTLNIKGKINMPCPLISICHTTPHFNILDSKLCKYHFSKSNIINRFIDFIVEAVHEVRNQVVFSYIAYKSRYFVLLSNRFKAHFLPAKLFPNKIISIPNSVSVNSEKPVCSKKENNVLYVGRIRSEKRIDLLLKVWSEVEKHNDGWNLIIVGDGPDIYKCKSLSNDLRLRNIKWKGWAINPDEYYSLSKIFCLTSEQEGFATVLIEAQSFGCVPIAFDSYEAVHDIITDGYNGYIIPPFNIKEYANNLLDLMNNDEKLNNMSHNAISSVTRFEERSIMNRWRNLVESVVSNKC